MARNVGIVISAKDNFSSAVSKMAQANASFNKDLEGLQQKLEHFNKTKVDIKMDMSKAKMS